MTVSWENEVLASKNPGFGAGVHPPKKEMVEVETEMGDPWKKWVQKNGNDSVFR